MPISPMIDHIRPKMGPVKKKANCVGKTPVTIGSMIPVYRCI
jgi:hypothetical protein